MREFGNRLREYRERGSDPAKRHKLSQERFAELLSQELGTEGYPTSATLSNWERGTVQIKHQDRRVLLCIIKVLNYCGGLEIPKEANLLLEAGDYRHLNVEEMRYVAANVSPSAALPTTTSSTGGLSALVRALTPVPTPVPFVLPALPPQSVVGREAELARMRELLYLEDARTNVAPLALRGMGGVGKTTLALALGYGDGILAAFPDGVFWTALGLKPNIRGLLEHWGVQLNLNLAAAPNQESCRQILQTAFFSKKALLLVDDVWSSEQGRFFTTLGGPQCRTVLTTREAPIAHTLATRERTLRVEVLAPAAALELLRRLTPDAVASNRTAAMRLCERLEYLPLGLTLAGRLLANESDVPRRLARLLDELIEQRETRLQLSLEEGRLGGDEPLPTSLATILGLSVARLDRQTQERFAMLSTFGGEPLDWELEAAAAVWECSDLQAEQTLSFLVQLGLVEFESDHFRMHALLADYANELRKEWRL